MKNIRLSLAFIALLTGMPQARAAILFQDDFSTGTYSNNWTTFYGDSISGAAFSITGGTFQLQSLSGCGDARAAAGNTNWTDLVLDLDFKMVAGGNFNTAIVLFRVMEIYNGCDYGKYYQLNLGPSSLGVYQIDYSGGSAPVWQSSPLTRSFNLGEWHHLKLSLAGSTGQVLIDTNAPFNISGLTRFSHGMIGLKTINSGNAVAFDNIVVSDGNAATRPLLSAQNQRGALILTWPITFTNYSLQHFSGTSGLPIVSNAWQTVTGTTSNYYSTPMSNRSEFFRLQKQ